MESWRIFFTGVGGQGTLLATRVLGEAALLANIPVVVSEVHGMAQRGGVVESAVVIGEVRSPVISDGEVDILMAFEPLEALRAVRKCSASSLVICNTSPVAPFSVSSGRDQYPDVSDMMQAISSQVSNLIAYDARALAREAGSELSVNVVMLGTLMRHAKMPFDAKVVKKVLNTRTKKTFLEINLKAFDLGYEVL
ncbi:MAG: indolepyruvate oxidoreductase subunit beta [Deltaproteobacteria bacterium]|nr:MAG: indolepyruvate oxidoreductase subunit beta [Deltaproteobacteria bacterium]